MELTDADLNPLSGCKLVRDHWLLYFSTFSHFFTRYAIGAFSWLAQWIQTPQFPDSVEKRRRKSR